MLIEKGYNIGRNGSELRRNRDEKCLDYSKTYISDNMIEKIDVVVRKFFISIF